LVRLPKFYWKAIKNHFDTDNLNMMQKFLQWMKKRAAFWLGQGISPRRLALTLALGFAIGCIPVIGVTTALCAAVALTLRLNFPVIQAANWVAMPFQVALIAPFVRLGGRFFDFGSLRIFEAGSLLHGSLFQLLVRMGGMAGQALLAWLLIAVPAVALLTVLLTVLLSRIPVVTAAGAGD
jgi:uncharacterized protein (DUF2062 family)